MVETGKSYKLEIMKFQPTISEFDGSVPDIDEGEHNIIIENLTKKEAVTTASVLRNAGFNVSVTLISTKHIDIL